MQNEFYVTWDPRFWILRNDWSCQPTTAVTSTCLFISFQFSFRCPKVRLLDKNWKSKLKWNTYHSSNPCMLPWFNFLMATTFVYFPETTFNQQSIRFEVLGCRLQIQETEHFWDLVSPKSAHLDSPQHQLRW